MSKRGQGTKCRKNIAENFNRLSRVHECYGRQTDRQTGDNIIANGKVSSRSLKRLSSKILFHMIINVQSVADSISWQIKIGLHQFDNLSQVKVDVTTFNNSCFLLYSRSLTSSLSFSKTLPRLYGARETISFLAFCLAICVH